MNIKFLLISLICHSIILLISFKTELNDELANFELLKESSNIIKVKIQKIKNKKITDLNKETEKKQFSDNLAENYNFAEKEEISQEDLIYSEGDDIEVRSDENLGTINIDKSHKYIENPERFEVGKETNITTSKLEYFNFYKKMKIVIENKWRKILKKHEVEKSANILVTFKMNQLGYIIDKKIEKNTNNIPLDNEVLNLFDSIQLPKPPKDIFNNKEYLIVQWNFEIIY